MPEGNLDAATDPNAGLQVSRHEIGKGSIEMAREGDLGKRRTIWIGYGGRRHLWMR